MRSTKRVKGNSLLEFPTDYCVLDLETTGKSVTYDEIIEIGILRVRNDKVIDSYQTLIQPTPFIEDGKVLFISDFIADYTKIENEMLEDAPNFSEICNDVLEFIGSDVIVGHNVAFDINFLYDEQKKITGEPLKNDFFDTLRIARLSLKDIKNHKLTTLADHFGIDFIAHRAINDAMATFELKLKLERYIKQNNIDYYPKKFSRFERFDLESLKSEQKMEADPSGVFYGKNICFTGKLNRFNRLEAAQIAVNLGAKAQNGLTKKTNYLVIGEFDMSMGIKGNKSNKQKKAEKYILDGCDITILDEKTFIELLELDE